MKNLKRIKYYTMSSWNNSTAPAYNLKIYNVIDWNLQNKVFKLMETENFYDDINDLINEFNQENDYIYQAGFNGRSGGYLVLYKGGKKKSEYKSICTSCGQKNFTTIEKSNKCGYCGENKRVNKEIFDIYTTPGQSIEEKETPAEVLIDFRRLAISIIKTVEYMAKNNKVEEEVYTVQKTRKILV